MKLKMIVFILVNLLLSTMGVILVLFGLLIEDALWKPLLESVGTGLLAAGAVNVLAQTLILEKPTPLPPPPVRIEVAAEQRSATPQEIHDRKFTASKVDLVGISLNHFLEELLNDPRQRLINRLLMNNLQLRIFLVHPNSAYLRQRAMEDKVDLKELVRRQRIGVQMCVQFYKQLLAAYQSLQQSGRLDKHLVGNLQVKLLDFCPYITIYRVNEDDIYWGLYTSDKPGLELPLFRTNNKQDPSLYKHLHQHIHGLIERDRTYPDLVGLSSIGAPFLNEELAESITNDS